ncbi:MAG: molybdopterin-dependent oxidoreductase [Gammaproteobacteria bacterium]
MANNEIKTTCPYCGVGCGVLINTDENGQRSLTGDKSHPANFGRLCSKGSALLETIDLDDRLLFPEVDGERVNWDTALEKVASGFSEAIKNHGPDSVAFYVSGQLLTEDYYVANKLMKGFIGSANIDTNSRLCMSSAVAGHKRAFGSDTVANCYEDLEQADLLVIIGSNAAWCHPVLYQRMKAAAEKNDQQKMIVIDPRRTATCEDAWLHLPIKSGTDVVLFNGLLTYLVSENTHNQSYIDKFTEQFYQAKTVAKNSAPSIRDVAEICDISVEDVTLFYKEFVKTEKTVSFFSQGVNQSSSGTDKVNSIINCHLAMGRIGRPGCGAFSITGQPNAMGGREVGGLSNMLAAHMDFSTEDVDRVQRFWSSPQIAKTPGLKAVDLFDAVNRGDIKAIWVMATNPVDSLPDADKVKKALKKCELVVVSDCVKNTDTVDCATVLLPAVGWAEKSGTVTNSERRISRMRSFLPAAGEAKPDWWIVSQVAKRMDFTEGFNYSSSAEIFNEHAELSGFENQGDRGFDISGLGLLSEEDYDQLLPIQWPIQRSIQGSVNQSSKVRIKRMLDDGKFFTASGKAQFISIDFNPPKNSCNDDYPLVLNTGRVRDHWHTLTRTGKASTLSRHIVEPYATLHSKTATEYGVKENDLINISSTNGEIIIRAKLSNDQREEELFVPIHWTDYFSSNARVDKLVSSATDPFSGQPEFKFTPIIIRPEKFLWSGFLLSKKELTQPSSEYWSKSIEKGFWRYEMSGMSVPDDWSTWVEELLGNKRLEFKKNNIEQVNYFDQYTSTYRTALFQNGQLLTCFFASEKYSSLPNREWLLTQFSVNRFEPAQCLRILAGVPADPAEDTGPVVCSCFNVGENTIKKAITEKNLSSVDAIGDCVKAGTNCGSCRPELKSYLQVVKNKAMADKLAIEQIED